MVSDYNRKCEKGAGTPAMEYEAGNIFAKILAGEIPCNRVYEDDQLLAFRDIAPQAPVHILIIPKAQRATLADCTEADAQLLGKLQLAAAKIAKQEGLSDFRTVINCGTGAGQTVFHLHLHLLGGKQLGEKLA